ncbi:MAG: tetratricopeptide repeat protein [Planctomycetes bacterium]|nr:tetratricopeptide repeat protein [Planctomycetota bacterium]
MDLDPYAPCPCGSGKKFKWCCMPIHLQMDKAFQQEEQGQHEMALRLMEEVVAQHPDNPEAWGRRAELLYRNGKVEEAENSLQKALEVNPDYPFGHLLRGSFRQNEGEIPGALLEYRKAAELYDPQAGDILAMVYIRIGDCELKLNRPVAARAALKMALHYQPTNEELRQGFDGLFGPDSKLPEAACKEYTFLSPTPGTAGSRREAWDRALAEASRAKLAGAVRAFEQLTAADEEDAAAWYNLGVARAWQGDNRGGLAALDRYVNLEADEGKAGAAWTLGEVLRLGYGMQDQADVIERSAIFQIRNPQQFFPFLQKWEREQRLIGVQVDQEHGVITGLVLDRVSALTAESAAAKAPGLGAYLLVLGGLLRLSNTTVDGLHRVHEELKQTAGPALSEARMEQRPAAFTDVLTEALAFPVQISDKEEATRRVLDHMGQFFEEKWIHRPLHALDQTAPVDAAGHPVRRKKLRGVVQFLQDCARGGQGQLYDFDRLRRKLGLLGEAPAAAAVSTGPDIEAMSAAELGGLQHEQLTDDNLERAYQAAQKLEARELAGRFAQSLVARPARADRPDRYPWYTHLVQQALAQGDTDTALNYLNEGEKADCEQNQGRRRNEYELRRGQVHVRRGELDQAQDIFDRLIERVPSEPRYQGSAAEAMLSARQGARALKFAEQGLAQARARNDRDSEQYFLELVSAARKQQ